MDAEYYFMNGQRLAAGQGWTEMILWNYLDNPEGIPHPSHLYWKPLASVLAAAGMFIAGNLHFSSAQLFFIFCSALIPPITFGIGKTLFRDEKGALISGLLAMVPGYYMVYLTTTSTITPYAFLGGLYCWLVLVMDMHKEEQKSQLWCSLLLGGISGLMHLTRADGVLWLIGAILVATFLQPGLSLPKKDSNFLGARKKIYQILLSISSVLFGYLLVSLPWYFHTTIQEKTTAEGGGILTLWMTDYNQTFVYPASELNPVKWLEVSIWEHLVVRLKAVFSNTLTTVFVQGEILLFPLLVIGISQLKNKRPVYLIGFIWLFTFVVMSFIFPFSGPRGGFLHSSAAFQPLIWALMPAGFDWLIRWGERKRGWQFQRAYKIFGGAGLIILLVLTSFLFFSRVLERGDAASQWNKSFSDYHSLEGFIEEDFPDKNEVIMINNPPGYYLASDGRPAVVIPDGDEAVLREVVERYGVSLVVFDHNTVDGLRHLYDSPSSNDWLKYLYPAGEFQVYVVEETHDEE